jgi:flagellar hook protein FlgE
MSFGTGLSGLNAASKNLDVIGHNIANANTTGMKAGRAEFAEMYASALGAAGGSNGGIGVAVATVSQLFTQGNLKVTGNNMDIAVNGEGLFKVAMTDGSTAYTRNGEFKLDKDGYIITNNKAKLQGYQTDREGKRTSVVTSDLKLPTGGVMTPQATGTDPLRPDITLKANLDSRVTDQTTVAYGAGTPADPYLKDEHKTYGTALNVYDTLGNAVPLQIYFVKTANANEWEVNYSLDNGVSAPVATGTIEFDPATGQLLAGQVLPDVVIPAAAPPATVPSANIEIFGAEMDITGFTQFGSNFGIYDLQQDGFAPGELTSINIGEDGIITAAYSNGTSQAAGQISLTNFRNLQGLAPVNGGYWLETAASGAPVTGAPLEGRLGQIRSGALEESNVDMTAELVNMIVAQRSYQANAQTIKTQDQVLSTLVNLR